MSERARITSRRRLGVAGLVVVLAVAGCGDEPKASGRGAATAPAAPKSSAPAAKPAAAKPAAAAKGGKGAKGAPQMLRTYPKVDDSARKAFTRDDFAPDPTGDSNRDPFRSYLVDDQATVASGKQPTVVDECDKRMVAEQFGLRDLSLLGIVKKGTTAYALFKDSQGFGHIARRGDCLSKDKARIKEIGASTIIVQVRGDAPPGQPAPDPREEEWRLHPEQLELQQQAPQTGEN